jgi:RHS repeat-associated protein
VGFDQYDQVWFGIDAGPDLRAARVGDCCAYFETSQNIPIILRVEKHSGEYTFKYKYNPNEAWTVMAPQSIAETPAYVGIISRVVASGDEEMNMDWSYFRLERWDEETLRMAPGAGEDSPEIGKEKEPVRGEENRPTSTPTRQPTATLTRTPTPTGTPTPQVIGLKLGSPEIAANFAHVGFNLPLGNGLPLENRVQVGPLAVQHQQTMSQTIDYTYDPLNRLTNAEYSNGDYFLYTYDTVGNRLYHESLIDSVPFEADYLYDEANHLIDVNDVEYTWDNNGNLLDDGVNEYNYNSANRLSFVSGVYSSSYDYNGLGDRLQQTVNSNTTTYVLDLNAGLTQVLDDGSYSYTYGLNRILQDDGSESKYFLEDAQGSARQITNGSGEVTYAASYTPYGEVLSNAGMGATSFGFTGEQVDDATGMMYLRARYYSPYLNQFIQPDTIVPDPRIPADWNEYTYARDNPVNYTDPSGKISVAESKDADTLINQLYVDYNVRIIKDWGYRLPAYLFYGLVPPFPEFGCTWEKGNWRSYDELKITRDAIEEMVTTLHGAEHFKSAMGGYTVNIHRVSTETYLGGGGYSSNNVILPNNPFGSAKLLWTKGTIVHELAHVWDTRHWLQPDTGMMYATKSYDHVCGTAGGVLICFDFYDKNAASEEAPTDYAKNNAFEDWADSFKVFMYPSQDAGMLRSLGLVRKSYIQEEIDNLH